MTVRNIAEFVNDMCSSPAYVSFVESIAAGSLDKARWAIYMETVGVYVVDNKAVYWAIDNGWISDDIKDTIFAQYKKEPKRITAFDYYTMRKRPEIDRSKFSFLKYILNYEDIVNNCNSTMCS